MPVGVARVISRLLSLTTATVPVSWNSPTVSISRPFHDRRLARSNRCQRTLDVDFKIVAAELLSLEPHVPELAPGRFAGSVFFVLAHFFLHALAAELQVVGVIRRRVEHEVIDPGVLDVVAYRPLVGDQALPQGNPASNLRADAGLTDREGQLRGFRRRAPKGEAKREGIRDLIAQGGNTVEAVNPFCAQIAGFGRRRVGGSG